METFKKSVKFTTEVRLETGGREGNKNNVVRIHEEITEMKKLLNAKQEKGGKEKDCRGNNKEQEEQGKK